MLGFEAVNTSCFLTCVHLRWPYLCLLLDVYSFCFEIKKICFKAKTFKEIRFLTDTLKI